MRREQKSVVLFQYYIPSKLVILFVCREEKGGYRKIWRSVPSVIFFCTPGLLFITIVTMFSYFSYGKEVDSVGGCDCKKTTLSSNKFLLFYKLKED
jgi:hypothetical protein